MTPVILVSVKGHPGAKSRLAPLLTERERLMVAGAMFEDLVLALLPLSCQVALVTNSARAAARAGQLGWKLHWEENQISESASVDAASRQLSAQGVEAVLRLPADLPLIQPRDVEELLSLPVKPPSAILVPSWDRTGTNALLRTPPDLFPSRFGPNSFALHVSEAAAAGADLRIVENPRVALDLDDPGDIARFIEQTARGQTYRTLMRLNIKERLAIHGVPHYSHRGVARDS